MREEWRNIEDYEGLYQVSNLGRVKSLKRPWVLKDVVLIQHLCRKGYCKVTLTKAKKRSTFSVHRLVALTFIPNPENLATVDHEDKCKVNNTVTNLRWMTQYDNWERSNCDNPTHKLNQCKANEIRELYQTGEFTGQQLSSQFDISVSQIYGILNNRYWKNE